MGWLCVFLVYSAKANAKVNMKIGNTCIFKNSLEIIIGVPEKPDSAFLKCTVYVDVKHAQ